MQGSPRNPRPHPGALAGALVGVLVGVLAGVLLAGAASAEVLRIDSVVVRRDGSRDEGRLWIDGDRVRMEFGRAPEGGSRWTWIYRGDRELLWAIGRGGMRYAEIPERDLDQLGRTLADARREVDRRLAGLPPEERARVEALLGAAARPAPAVRRPDRIAEPERETELDGIPVRVHPLLAGEERTGELWVCDWQDADVARRKLRVLRSLARFQRELLDQLDTDAALRQAAPPFELFDQLDGYPLRFETPAATTRFATPEEVEQEDARFERPLGAVAAPAAEILTPGRAAQEPAGGSSSGGSSSE